jgi:hypothetical protein
VQRNTQHKDTYHNVTRYSVITERRKLAHYAEFRGAHFKHKLENAWPGNTKGGSMAVQLTSCLTVLD